jgi:thiamine pyrophosphate-dependent acetolactate synthase large subunit-like protein
LEVTWHIPKPTELALPDLATVVLNSGLSDNLQFAVWLRSRGADGFRCATPAEVRPAIMATLRSPQAAILEAIVDTDEPPADPEVRASKRIL